MAGGFVRLGVVLALCLAIVFAASGGTKPDLRGEMTATEFARCGLEKLTTNELQALEEWLAKRSASGSPARRLGAGSPGDDGGDALVAFNTASRKYHCPSCRHARQCTKNCIEVQRSEALARGGQACQVCGGTCRSPGP